MTALRNASPVWSVGIPLSPALRHGQRYAPCPGFHNVTGQCGKPGAPPGMDRPHVPDPIHFHQSIRVTCQSLGWQSEHRYPPLADDVAATAWWYQQMPTSTPPLGPDG